MMMFEFQRQHPVAALAKSWNLVKDNLINIFIVLFVAGGSSTNMLILTTVAGFFVLLGWGALTWYRFQYKVENGTLIIESGVISRRSLTLARKRIQVIDVSAGPIQRLFGLVSVEIRTAGRQSSRNKIEAVTKEEAKRLRESLQNGAKESAETAEDEEVTKERTIAITNIDLVKAAVTSGSFGVVLSILGSIYSQLDQLITEERLERWLQSVELPGTQTYIYGLIVVVLLAWLLAFLGTLVLYGGYSLTITDDHVVIRRGLFEHKQITIPFDRIQGIRIVEGVLRQPFGWASLLIESAGFGDSRGKSTVLFPLISRKKISAFLDEVVPEYNVREQATTLPGRSLRRYLFRSVVPVLVLTGLGYWLTPVLIHLAWLIIPAAFWAWLRYRDAAVAVSDTFIIVRSRTLARTTALVPRGRIQDVQLRQTIMQKRQQLISADISIASGKDGAQFGVSDLDASMADPLLRITNKGEIDWSPIAPVYLPVD